jgi:AcrR family transcriptional regulator
MANFVERGFDGVSFDEVSERAGVARTTVYRRWSSKAALVAEAIATARGSPELEVTAHGSFSNADEMIRAVAQALSAPGFRRVAAHLIGAAPEHPELLSAYWETYMAPRRAVVFSLMEAARARSVIRAGTNLDVLLDIIGGAVAWLVLVRPKEPSTQEIEEHLRAVLREVGIDIDTLTGHAP